MDKTDSKSDWKSAAVQSASCLVLLSVLAAAFHAGGSSWPVAVLKGLGTEIALVAVSFVVCAVLNIALITTVVSKF